MSLISEAELFITIWHWIWKRTVDFVRKERKKPRFGVWKSTGTSPLRVSFLKDAAPATCILKVIQIKMVEEQGNRQIHRHQSSDISLYLPNVPSPSSPLLTFFYFPIKRHLWILKIIKSKIFFTNYKMGSRLLIFKRFCYEQTKVWILFWEKAKDFLLFYPNFI